ncbi:YdbH domain-containing protein [Novosphingobium terrae]|uniref:YdbH domain-containing protein n=1 Tax=Novosphingobium terrae TaxID=2726189 RepID=UPI00197F4106|nr:YdbH domain-containing protein [Novosphingobium terrae]
MIDLGGNTQTDEQDNMAGEPDVPVRARSRWRRRALVGAGGVSAVVVLTLGAGWIWRDAIAKKLIDHQLEAWKLPARYRVAEVGATHIDLADVSVGDPAHPDFTAGRLAIEVSIGSDIKGFGRVTLEHVRLAGRWQNGKLTLGELDRLLSSSSGPSGLPNAELVLRDAQARFETPAGVASLTAAGAGHLRNGFAGTLALRAPHLAGQGCEGGASLDGRLSVAQGKPRLTGPLDLTGLHCNLKGLHLDPARVAIDAKGDADLAGGEVLLDLAPVHLATSTGAARALGGHAQLTMRHGRIAAGWELAGQGVNLPGIAARRIGVDGRISGDADFDHLTAEGGFTGEGVTPDSQVMATLAGWRQSTQGTLVAPLLARLSAGLMHEGQSSKLKGSWTMRRGDRGFSLVIPTARWSGPRAHLEGSRLMVNGGGLTGNLALTGGDLPTVNLRVAPVRGGGQSAQLAIAPWAADGAAITVPALHIEERGGRVAMAGQVLVSGAVPGGSVRELGLPIAGDWTARDGLVLGRTCAPVHYAGATFDSLDLSAGSFDLCPGEGAPHAVLAVGRSALHWGASVPNLSLAGTLSGEALHVASGALTLGERHAEVQDIVLTLGTGGDTTRAHIDKLTAELRDPAGIHGTAEGGSLALAALTMDIGAFNSPWRWADGALVMDGASLAVTDRLPPVRPGATPPDARFQPLVARDVAAKLVKGVFSAQGEVRAAASDRVLAQVSLMHDLSASRGTLDAKAPALRFDKGLQPQDISKLSTGMIADASGVLSADAHIAWSNGRIRSSGHVSSEGFDFASAAGPVRGVKGTVTFTDLLNMVTAPNQHVTVAAINPGIEADNGDVIFALEPNRQLRVSRAEWPFLNGRMWMEPFVLRFGEVEARKFSLDVEGIDAAEFLAHMDMSNLNATGLFDGHLPLVFDDKGGHVVAGYLTARPPGGTVAYIGALTYKNLSPTANFAFRTLRDLKYQQMRIDMNGDLAGELVSRVELRGLTQGKKASRNFLTRQIGKLPIQFNVNLRAPFYSLIGSVRSLYDAKAVADPRSVGLVGSDGKPVATPSQPAANPAQSPQSTGIQPPVSEHRP